MRTQRADEIGLLAVVVLLTAIALTPLLRADQPCTHDGGLHYFRITALRHALKDGLPLSRWVPDLAFGYGYPFFNYRAAFSYYLGLGLYLTGLPLPLALNMVYVLSLVGSAIGAYLLGRDLFGRRAGVVAAVAYVYAPYTFIDALVRGNMPESVALALFPFIMWAFRRLLLGGQARYLLASAGTLALLWLTHNISSLTFTPFLVLYILVVWMARGRRDHLVAAGVALALGVGLTAFFWAPALLEKGEVQLHLSRTTRNNDFHYNFVNLSEVLAPPESSDPALLNPPLRLPVGLPLAILALLGTAVALWRWRGAFGWTKDDWAGDVQVLENRERWGTVAFLALSSVAMIFMATRASLAVWENLPLIEFVQFPWRFVGRAVLPLSLLAAALVAALPRTPVYASRFTRYALRLPWLAVLVCVPLLILAALPFTYPPTGYCPTKPRPDILDLFAYERGTGLVGVDPEGSYFPVTVQTRPVGSPLEAQYAANVTASERRPIARFDAGSLPEGAIVHRAAYTPNHARLEIETPRAVRARYLAFAFPGWRVLVDDRPVEIIPSDPEGLITFDLPAGRHAVEVDWGGTPVRAVATMLSLVALASVAFIAYTAVRGHLAHRIRAESPASPVNQAQAKATELPGKQIASLALLALALLAFKLLVVDRTHTVFRRPGLRADGTLPGVGVPLEVRFDDGVRLLGYDRSVETMPADGTLHLALYWSAYTRPNRSYKSTVVLIDPDGRPWSDKTPFPRRGYADLPPSPAWGDGSAEGSTELDSTELVAGCRSLAEVGRYAVEGLDIEPLPGTPPGRYDLLLTAFDRETLAPLSVLDKASQVSGPNLTVGRVELTRPSRPPDSADVPMQVRLDASMGPLTLVGANLDRDEAAPGDPALVTLFWQVASGKWQVASGKWQVASSRGQVQGDGGRADLRVHLALVDGGGGEAMAWELPPVRDDWPTTLWQAGDLWRGQHLLRLPTGLESSIYTWQLYLYESTSPESRIPESPIALGQLRINAPERLWQAPPLQLSLDADLGQQVTLLGANLEPATAVSMALQSSTQLTVTLAWQARAEMTTSYRVFLHLLNPDGSLLTQSDGEPAGWTRPTTGWTPGEVVLDERSLNIPADAPPGQYALVAGLYDLDTRERLSLPDGTTAIPLVTLTLKEP
jgi:hypothetical protein